MRSASPARRRWASWPTARTALRSSTSPIPRRPSCHVRSTSGGAAQAVAESAGIAYVGTSSGRLVSVDLETGAVLDVASLPGAVQDLSISGRRALRDDRRRRTCVLTRPVTAAGRHGGLPAADRPGDSEASALRRHRHALRDALEGVQRLHLANPLLPAFVVAGQQPRVRVAPDGAERVGARLRSGGREHGPRRPAGHGALRPQQSRRPRRRGCSPIPTPGQAFAGGDRNGYGLVADGDAGVQVVNYIAADTGTNPPTLSLTTNQPVGIAQEGQLYRVTAHVEDDVQVRAVEFCIDGGLATTDVVVSVRIPPRHAAEEPADGIHAARPRVRHGRKRVTRRPCHDTDFADVTAPTGDGADAAQRVAGGLRPHRGVGDVQRAGARLVGDSTSNRESSAQARTALRATETTSAVARPALA